MGGPCSNWTFPLVPKPVTSDRLSSLNCIRPFLHFTFIKDNYPLPYRNTKPLVGFLSFQLENTFEFSDEPRVCLHSSFKKRELSGVFPTMFSSSTTIYTDHGHKRDPLSRLKLRTSGSH